MSYTPLNFLSDDELINSILTKEEPSWEELELAHRLEAAIDEINELKQPVKYSACEGVPV